MNRDAQESRGSMFLRRAFLTYLLLSLSIPIVASVVFSSRRDAQAEAKEYIPNDPPNDRKPYITYVENEDGSRNYSIYLSEQIYFGSQTEDSPDTEVEVFEHENGSRTIILRLSETISLGTVVAFSFTNLYALADYSWSSTIRFSRAWERNRQLESEVEEAIQEMERKSRKWKKLVAPRAYHFQSIQSLSSKGSISVN